MENLTVRSTSFALCFTGLFVIAPLFIRGYTGGSGLDLPYNLSAWLFGCWTISVGLLLMLSRKRFIYPGEWLYFCVFPTTTVLTSLFATLNEAPVWLFRQLFIFGGFFFLFALFQFNLKQKSIDQALHILIFATFIHASSGILQVIDYFYHLDLFPYYKDGVPRGIFQQINVQATFLATGINIIVFTISRPQFKNATSIAKSFLYLTFGLAVYVIFASGSRIGLLSLLISTPLILFCRKELLKKQKKALLTLLLISCLAALLAQNGLNITIDKATQATEQNYSSARKAMYRIGINLVSEKPLTGHGIGNFQNVWNPEAAAFYDQQPDATLPSNVTHPHNELLFWAIEGGIPSLIGIVSVMLGTLLACYRCGRQKGGAYLAMLLPITLHTQVELPFYISSLHWFLFLFIIFLALRHRTNSREVTMSKAANQLTAGITLLFCAATSLFFVDSARAQADIYNFVHRKNANAPHLQIALNNLYFNRIAERIAVNSTLHASIEMNDREKVLRLKKWIEEKLSETQELKLYADLIAADEFLDPEEKGCRSILLSLSVYPYNKTLKEAAGKCALVTE